jgi:hypothetical protein
MNKQKNFAFEVKNERKKLTNVVQLGLSGIGGWTGKIEELKHPS